MDHVLRTVKKTAATPADENHDGPAAIGVNHSSVAAGGIAGHIGPSALGRLLLG
jgi:hypothetical protein